MRKLPPLSRAHRPAGRSRRSTGGLGALALALVVLAPGGPIQPPAAPKVRVVIRLADPTPRAAFLMDAIAGAPTLEARHEVVVEGLQAIHARAALDAAPILDRAEAAGALVEIDRLWIVNAVVAEVDPDWIERLEVDPAIAEVIPDARIELGASPDAAVGSGGARPTAFVPTPELQQINVDDAWAEGITGKGAIVANLDTGVNGADDTLEAKWRGLYAGPDATWLSALELTVFPVDDDPVTRGHGTASMGLMAGGEQSFGVAYDATWIAGDLFRDSRLRAEGYVSTSLKTLQWMADPDEDPTTSTDVPDVVSNSYGLNIPDTTGRLPCDDVFNDAIDALEAAGAIVIWSAGNEGPTGVTSPASRTASPVNAFAVGAVDATNNVLGNSGRGPSRCGGPNAVKPEVVAPGSNVLTRTRFNQGGRFTGTSFSTPIVGGVLALMRSKNPTITPEAAKTILLETARDLGVPGDDNDSGRGLVDAAAALARVQRPTQPLARLIGFRPAGAGAGKLAPAQQELGPLVLRPGAGHDLVPRLSNHGPAIGASTATLSSPTPGVRVTRPTIPLAAAETGTFFGPAGGDAFRVELDPGVAPGTDVQLVLTVQGAAIGPFRMNVEAGDPVPGTFATHDRGRVRLSVTNFGALGYYTGGHAAGFALRGEGFRFPPTSPNWLFHASFMAGTGPNRLSDDIPYGEDVQNDSDFFPIFGAPLAASEAAGGQRFVAQYDDRHAVEPVDLRVRQESFAFADAEASDFVILQYVVTNAGAQALNGLRLGLFADWDLPGTGGTPAETAGWDAELLLGFVEGRTAGQPVVGVVWLDQVSPGLVTYAVLSRDSIGESNRRGLAPAEAFEGGEEFSDREKWEALISGQSRTSDARPGDLWQVIGTGPISLAAGATDTVAVALVAGESRTTQRAAAVAARETYFRRILGTEPPPPPPPAEEVVLRQNFPNPFRSGQATVVQFALPDLGGESIDLAVYDVTGRRVRTLVRGSASPGEQAATWDGTDDSGSRAPAGVYVVRLLAGGREERIRVLLLP